MNCKTCGKDITSLHFFTRNEYCNTECEKKDKRDSNEKMGDIFNGMFGGNNPFK